MGIPSDLLPHVFDLFRQADQSLDRSEGGLGIGLTVVQLLVDMHGGRVEAFSAGAGQGSEFVVRLPLLEPRPDATSPAAPGEPAPVAEVSPLRILIIEDNTDSAEMLGFVLRLKGHEVQLAAEGATGLDAASRFHPDVVLCDLGLPRMNGYEVARQLRAMPGLPSARLIALSGYGRDEDRQRAQESGFEFHLVKPVNPNQLFELLDAFRRDHAASSPGPAVS